MSMVADLDAVFGLQTLQSAFEDGDPHAIWTVLTRAKSNVQSLGRGEGYVDRRVADLARILTDELADRQVTISDLSKVHLILSLAPSGIDKVEHKDIERISSLLLGVDIPAHLNELDALIKKEFYQEIAVSKLVDDASMDWEKPEWTAARKIAYGQHIADVFCDVLGMPQILVKGVSVPTYKTKTGALFANLADVFCGVAGITNPFKKRPIMGFCTQKHDGTTAVGLNVDAALDDYKEFHATLHHEIMHGIHIYLGDIAKYGRIKEIPEEFRPVAVLLMAMMDPRVYAHSTRTNTLYRQFGVEDHAERNALDFADTMQDVYKRYQLAEKAGFRSTLDQRSLGV